MAADDQRVRATGLAFRPVDPAGPEAATVMRRYFAELQQRFGFDPAGSTHEGPFLVASDDGAPVAGGGIRTLPDGRAEVKRMWVDPAWRGSGLGRRTLAALEDLARGLGHVVVVLDTNEVLTEAVALYDRSGYRRIPRYNDNPYAQLFFEKHLS